MSDCNGVHYLGFLLVGMGVGAGLALLFAPQSGKDTRKYLARRAEEGSDYVTSVGKGLRDKAEEAVGRGKDWASKLAQ
ncbi:MAG: YtxH domain-containing protein [Terriglobia bacterium]|jgi:gas vesicle protein